MSDTDDLIPEGDLAKRLGLKLVTLRAWRARRKGPAWVNLGRRVFYPRTTLETWIAAQVVDPAKLRRA